MRFERKQSAVADGARDWRVEPVPSEHLESALTLVVGAGRGGPDVAAGVAALRGYLDDDVPAGHDLWWACQGAQGLAAALAVRSPGRTAVVLHSTTDTGLIPAEPLADLLAAMAERVCRDGATLVQALLPPSSRSDILAFEQAGFGLLAELIYMRQCLRGHQDPPADAGVTFRHYNARTHDLFARTIVASYADSLDCPSLEGLRDTEDVLAGHKAAGVFRPDLWTLALVDGQPAGVVLLNQNATQNVAEIVYMGVAKAFRGRGLGRALLARAAQLAAADRFGAISLAVDASNHFARKIYDDAGFVEASRRLAYVRTAQSPPAAPPRGA
ncbi:MAG: GNAT family N-acetyltransferase [Planctomycetes bacterium]|nr:GNAT family N-acetyltransferase [Planctomycetota bacterium]